MAAWGGPSRSVLARAPTPPHAARMSRRAAPPPVGFRALARVARRCGGIERFARPRPAALRVVPRGYVGPAPLREELVLARAFGAAHPERWDYVVDTTSVRFACPLDPLWLHAIPALPHLARYLVIAPSPLVRALVRAARPLVRVDAVVADRSELEP